MREEEIRQKLREAFELGESDVIIDRVTNPSRMRELGLSDSDFSSNGICWEVMYNHHPQSSPVSKFDLNKLNDLKQPLVLRNWFFNCKISAQKKEVKFPIMFSNCHANLENNSNTSLFSFQDFKFEKDVIFSGIEFVDVFKNTEFKKVTFRNRSKWQRYDQQKEKILNFSFDEIKVHQELVLQDLEFSKGDALNKTEGDFSKFKKLEKISIINCEFEQEVKVSGITLETLILSGVSFKEQVSFIQSKIKELVVRIDSKALFDDHRPLKNTVFLKPCFFKNSEIGSLEFGDGTEFEDLSFLNIFPIDSESQTSEGKAKKSKLIELNFQNVKINGNFDFNNSGFQVEDNDQKIINLLSFESVEFGGEVSFDSMRIENFEMKGNENPIKDSVLKSHCHFSNVRIEKADFSNTQFGGEVQFDGVKFNQSVSFKNAIFDKNISFSFSLFPDQSSSETQIDFSSATFKGFIELEKTDEEEAKLYNCSFLGASFEGGFKSSEVSLVSPNFCSCTFKKPFKFKDLKCEGDVDFSKAVFEDEVIFGVEVRDEKRD